jgi:hypothetical protein
MRRPAAVQALADVGQHVGWYATVPNLQHQAFAGEARSFLGPASSARRLSQADVVCTLTWDDLVFCTLGICMQQLQTRGCVLR